MKVQLITLVVFLPAWSALPAQFDELSHKSAINIIAGAPELAALVAPGDRQRVVRLCVELGEATIRWKNYQRMAKANLKGPRFASDTSDAGAGPAEARAVALAKAIVELEHEKHRHRMLEESAAAAKSMARCISGLAGIEIVAMALSFRDREKATVAKVAADAKAAEEAARKRADELEREVARLRKLVIED